jgi:Mif2/CENP-C like
MTIAIAWGAHSVQPKDVANAHFQYDKYFSTPFMSTGILEFPINGFKQIKHSGKTHFAFFVQYGKLEVTIEGEVFNISTGGVWQVPRGKNTPLS